MVDRRTKNRDLSFNLHCSLELCLIYGNLTMIKSDVGQIKGLYFLPIFQGVFLLKMNLNEVVDGISFFYNILSDKKSKIFNAFCTYFFQNSFATSFANFSLVYSGKMNQVQVLERHVPDALINISLIGTHFMFFNQVSDQSILVIQHYQNYRYPAKCNY